LRFGGANGPAFVEMFIFCPQWSAADTRTGAPNPTPDRGHLMTSPCNAHKKSPGTGRGSSGWPRGSRPLETQTLSQNIEPASEHRESKPTLSWEKSPPRKKRHCAGGAKDSDEHEVTLRNRKTTTEARQQQRPAPASLNHCLSQHRDARAGSRLLRPHWSGTMVLIAQFSSSSVLPGSRANAGPAFLCRAPVNSVDGKVAGHAAGARGRSALAPRYP
jgi:hypothetical protein